MIDDYLNRVPKPQKAQLQRIREIVHHAVPEAKEVISYGMPGFKYKNGYLVGFAAFKDHMSLFPTSRPVEVLQHKLSEFELSKGTIRFTLDKPIPKPIIEELVKLRLADIL